MAADSQVTAGQEITAFTQKVHRLDDGRIIGCCGPSISCAKFREFMINGGDKPDLSDEFRALILHPSGVVSYIEKDFVELPYRAPAGIGSGSEFAIGAMLAGASPRKAVELAIDRDTHSGGEVHSIAL